MRPSVSFYDKPPTYGYRRPANVYRFFPFRTTPHSPAPVRLRSHSCHLPARSIAASPLWLKTVTRGLCLRCFTPPRRAHSGEGISGQLFYNVISTGVRAKPERSGEISHGKSVSSVCATSVFPSGRLPRRCAPRNDNGGTGVRNLFAAKPSVGRDALVPPHYVYGYFVPLPRDLSTTLEMTWLNRCTLGLFGL